MRIGSLLCIPHIDRANVHVSWIDKYTFIEVINVHGRALQKLQKHIVTIQQDGRDIAVLVEAGRCELKAVNKVRCDFCDALAFIDQLLDHLRCLSGPSRPISETLMKFTEEKPIADTKLEESHGIVTVYTLLPVIVAYTAVILYR